MGGRGEEKELNPRRNEGLGSRCLLWPEERQVAGAAQNKNKQKNEPASGNHNRACTISLARPMGSLRV
jgi:hypothetical protein